MVLNKKIPKRTFENFQTANPNFKTIKIIKDV